jgi:hypothetical protein
MHYLNVSFQIFVLLLEYHIALYFYLISSWAVISQTFPGFIVLHSIFLKSLIYVIYKIYKIMKGLGLFIGYRNFFKYFRHFGKIF